ncbi:MAG: homocysteine S-methyltransferase family protein [candidate division WOR-3 bacterium]|nr:MAG: homocysteine S-methyltransferase family protein [candidate division WOR-3 bacterium]
MKRFDAILRRRVMFLDGALGHNLLDKGLTPGESPSILNLKNPEAVYNLHRAYVDAGSDVILTNTFAANPITISSHKLKNVITAGVRLAKRAAGKNALVVGDVGPLGELMRPFGELDFDDVHKKFQTICRYLYQTGIKTFFVETFTSIIEAKAAFLAAKKFSSDVFISLSLHDNGRTIMGEVPESIAATFEALGAKAVGINCTMPEVAIEAVAKMATVTNLPLIIKPNAGKVEVVGTEVHHTISDRGMASYFKRFVQAGANIIGGCCGTSPDYIKAIAVHNVKPKRKRITKKCVIVSPYRTIEIEKSSTIIVGERLNPSGCKKVKQRLKHRDFKVYAEEARLQEEAGADALDVNAFIIDRDEGESLKNAVYEVLKNSRLPLFIDTQNFDAAQRVLSFYPGIGVYNSIPARKKELMKWLPMVKKFGFKAIISLVGKEIPRSHKQRMKNLNCALSIAKRTGFPQENLIFDPLVFSLATEQEQIKHTLRTVRILHERGMKTILGISNVSFGLPERSSLNATLVVAAIKSGATFLILNPFDETVMNAVTSAKSLLKGERLMPLGVRKAEISRPSVKTDLTQAIIYGDERAGSKLAQELLDSGTPPQKLIDNHIAQALNVVGEYYERGTFFIPDLLKAAEASKAILTIVKKYLPRTTKGRKVILATVKGDIHDIGKNIVAMIFESAGYDVIDLGKDVPAEKIVRAVKEHEPIALGLSALLTTTMPEMEHVATLLAKTSSNVKLIIGGPNVTHEYAKKIGAHDAATNAMDGLRILREVEL